MNGVDYEHEEEISPGEKKKGWCVLMVFVMAVAACGVWTLALDVAGL